MTNDQAPMTNETDTKRQCPITGAIGHCRLQFDWSLVLGHWSLVLSAKAFSAGAALP
jgi:hypothetical protein